MNNIFKLALSYSAIEGLQKGIYFSIIPILTYYISSQAYGNIAIVLMIVSFFQIFFTFSLEVTIMRYYIKIKNNKFKKTFLGTVFLSSLIFLIIWIVLISTISPYFFNYFFPKIPFSPYIMLAMLITVFKLINLFYITLLKATQDIKEYAIFYNIYFFIQTLLILIFVILFNLEKDIMYLIALLISQLITLYYIYKKMKDIIYFRINKRILFIALNYSFSIIPIKIVNVLNTSIDRYVLLYFIGGSAVGVYYFSLQIATAVQMVMLAINSAYIPKFYKLYELNKNNLNFSEINIMLNKIVLIAGVIEIIALKAYVLIFHFVNSEYSNAQQIIPILILYFSISIIYYINTNILSISASLNRKKIYGILIGIFLNIITSLILLKNIGMIGVAIGTVIGFLTSIFYFIFLVKKYTKFNINNFIYMLYILLLFIVNYFIDYLFYNFILSLIIIFLYKKRVII